MMSSPDGIDPRYMRSAELHQEASQLFPRGVTRAASAEQRPVPLRFRSASGSRIVDVDGNEYVDYALGTTTQLLGHRPRRVIDRLSELLAGDEPLFGGSHEAEIELAHKLVAAIPVAEMLSFHNSASEAIHVALGIARLYTGRQRIVKFEGHMNGWIAPMPVNVEASSPFDGVPEGIPGWRPSPDVSIAIWNDLDSVRALVEGAEPPAAVILEPAMVNAGVVPPAEGFLEGLRELCTCTGTLLIFDETITGFRFAYGGAQERFGVLPDIATLGKAFASGFPISVVASTQQIWDTVTRLGFRIRGTNNSHAISVAAALGAVDEFTINRDTIYPGMDAHAAGLATGLRDCAERAGVPLRISQFGPVLTATWGSPAVPMTYREIRATDHTQIARFGVELLDRGIHSMRGSRWFVSAAHTDEDLERTVTAAYDALRTMA